MKMCWDLQTDLHFYSHMKFPIMNQSILIVFSICKYNKVSCNLNTSI